MDAFEPEVGDATLEASLRDRQALASPSVILLPSRIRTLVSIKR
jgi:hypothetical protein